MADSYYKLAGTPNPTTDWTSEVVLEKDDDGNPTKVVGVNKPAQLSKSDKDKLKELGFEVENSSQSEAEEAEAAEAASGDALASAPIIGDAGVIGGGDQSDQSESKSDAKK